MTEKVNPSPPSDKLPSDLRRFPDGKRELRPRKRPVKPSISEKLLQLQLILAQDRNHKLQVMIIKG